MHYREAGTYLIVQKSNCHVNKLKLKLLYMARGKARGNNLPMLVWLHYKKEYLVCTPMLSGQSLYRNVLHAMACKCIQAVSTKWKQ